jgi:hypothetical protein
MLIRVPVDEDIREVFDNLREEDRAVLERMVGLEAAEKAVRHMVKHYPSQVFVADDGRTAALMIALSKWQGVAEIVAYTTTAVDDYRAGFYRTCLRGIGHLRTVMGLHKVEAMVWGDYQASINWLRHLGFEFEGRLRRHGPDGTDATLMGRIF